MTSNSINTPEYREEKKTLVENFTVQMEVNIAKLSKNNANTKINLNQANLVQSIPTQSPSKSFKENDFMEAKIKEETSNKV
jgi:hypothetical protein